MIRRLGTAAVLFGALLTVLFGGMWVWYFAVNGIGAYPVEELVLLAASIAAVATGAYCAWLVVPDLVRGTLTRRAERWTWVATGAFVAVCLASVWWFFLGLVGPIATLISVRVGRGPASSNPA